MILSSSSFNDDGIIPSKHGYKKGNLSPELFIKNIPENTKSLVLFMDDPDAMAAVGKIWTHWVIWNISPETKHIPENSIPLNSVQGLNDFEEIGYGGPAPPDKEHKYFFRLYALSKILDELEGSKIDDIKNSIRSSVIEETILSGRFSPQ